MIIHWTPIRSRTVPAYSQPEPDVLAVMGTELDFSDPTVVEYDILEYYRDYVQKAWRKDGALHLRVLAHYQAGNVITVERTIDYGTREALSWSE